MFLAERLEKIRQILLEKKNVDVNTLCELLEVSDVTIRKDLGRLEKEKFLKKIHGGAVLSEGVEARLPRQTEIFPAYEEKCRIAEKACTLVGKFDSLFIGPGSSCYLFAKALIGFGNVRVITNNVNAVSSLYDRVKKTVVLGGEIGYRDNMLFSSGEEGLKILDDIYLNKAIVTFNGIDMDLGFTLDELALAAIYEKIFSISKEIIVLASGNKFDHRSMYHSGPFSEADYVVTGGDIPNQYKERFNQENVRVI